MALVNGTVENLALLRELCETPGVSGREERLRAIMIRELKPLCDEVRVDTLGNVIALRRGSTGKKLAINAHMDEIGFIVSFIEEGGFLRLQPLGGHDPRNMVAQRVRVCADQDLVGLLYPGQKPPHLQQPEEREKGPKIQEFFVDLGLPEEEVKRRVPIGTPVVIQRELAVVGNGVSCKAMDDRVACFVMIEALRRTQSAGFEVYAVATVQEEVGVRGAITSAFAVQPDVGLAIDVTIAADIPGVPKPDRTTVLGGGVAIKIMDSLSISSPQLVAALTDLAQKGNIPYQMEILRAGGTDAGGIQRSRAGVIAGTLSIPCRYVHTSLELCHAADLDGAIDLLAAFIRSGHNYDYAPL